MKDSTLCVILMVHCLVFMFLLLLIKSWFALLFLFLLIGFITVGALFEKKEEEEELERWRKNDKS